MIIISIGTARIAPQMPQIQSEEEQADEDRDRIHARRAAHQRRRQQEALEAGDDERGARTP